MTQWPVILDVGNVWTQILQCPQPLAQAIWDTAVVRTEVAEAIEDGAWRPPGAGLQAQWDGVVRFSWWDSRAPGQGRIRTGLLDLVQDLARAHGAAIHVQDSRIRPETGVPDFPALSLRPYQRNAVDAALRSGRGVLDMPPRAGKTRTAIELTRSLWLPTVWIAPRTNICEQTLRAFDELCGKNFAVHHVGGGWRDIVNHHVVIMTENTADMLPPEFWRTREVLIVDEAHHAGSPRLHSIRDKAAHIYWFFGLTGTWGRSGNDLMALHAFMSNVVYRVTTTELVAQGFLVPAQIAVIPVTGPRVPGSMGAMWFAAQGTGTRAIAEHDHRQALVAWAAGLIAHTGRRVLVLVATKAQGRDLVERLRQLIPDPHPGTEFRPVEFVSTDRPKKIIRKILDSFNEHQEIRVLVGTSLVGEGTDLPATDALVYAPGGKAEISHRQAFFRVGTAVEGKAYSIVVDFDDQHNDTTRDHSQERLNTYANEPIATVTRLASPGDLWAWLQSRETPTPQ